MHDLHMIHPGVASPERIPLREAAPRRIGHCFTPGERDAR